MKMTQEIWNTMTPKQKEERRDLSDLSPQLIGLEGYRVEVVYMDGIKGRFIVGCSTGWKPCHLEVKRINSSGGTPACRHYARVTVLKKVR